MGLLRHAPAGVKRVHGAAWAAFEALHRRAWIAWARRRYPVEFDRVGAFCLFVGYPRSGHSLVGALLNAHRHAVISHELDAAPLIVAGIGRDDLYARIVARAAWFDLIGNRSNYAYQVPGQWQGRLESLRVIGDKRGGSVTRCLADHPDFLARVRSLTGVPLRLIHVVREPFDNIAAISIWNRMPLEEAADFFFFHCETTATLDALCAPGELITIRLEEMIREPAPTLSRLCAFLGLEAEPGYLRDATSIVFDAPTRTRRKVTWSPALIRSVAERAARYPFLVAAEPEG